MFAIRSPCKCPVCDYISTRHWNVKSHIKKKHGNVGEPMRVYGRRQLALGPEQDLAYLSDSASQNSLHDPQLAENQFFDMHNPREMVLAKEIKAIVPQFLEMEKLLRSENSSEKYIQDLLGGCLIHAIISPNPVSVMSKFVSIKTNDVAIGRMLSYMCARLNMNIFNAKDSIIRMKYS